MAWRTILISNPSKLTVAKENLCIAQESETLVPLDDILALVLDSPQIILSSALLSRMASYNIALISCDASHLPNGILTTFHKHSRQTKIALQQIAWSAAFKKRLQQKIIKNKIYNQAVVLKTVNKNMSNKIFALMKKVDSGDRQNAEATAATFYFKSIFRDFEKQWGKPFSRQIDCLYNAALNYGYSLVRGLIARSVVGNGFLPCWGLFHKSELNAFNLADDLIEPFRPFVDKWILDNFSDREPASELTLADRQEMMKVFYYPVKVNKEKMWLSNAVAAIVKNLQIATKKKDHQFYKEVCF